MRLEHGEAPLRPQQQDFFRCGRTNLPDLARAAPSALSKREIGNRMCGSAELLARRPHVVALGRSGSRNSTCTHSAQTMPKPDHRVASADRRASRRGGRRSTDDVVNTAAALRREWERQPPSDLLVSRDGPPPRMPPPAPPTPAAELKKP